MNPPNLEDGVCFKVGDPERMFPDARNDHAVATAKAVCDGCPVIDACRQWALDTGQRFGVWGGMSEDERRDLRRAPSRAPVAPAAAA